MLFKVKVKTIILRTPGKSPQQRAMSTWLDTEKVYPVFDVYSYRIREDKDSPYKMVTLFLIGDSASGKLEWTDASHLLYAGE